MSTYKLTPQQRKARAQALVAQRNAISKAKTNYTPTVAASQAQSAPKKDTNFLLRLTATNLDMSANILTGALKSLEGIVDLGAGLVGAVGGIFSDDFSEGVQDFIEYDAIGEWVGNPLDELLSDSYLEDSKAGQITEAVMQGVGQMLPAVIVTVMTAGAGAPTAISQAAGLATTGVSAAGTSTEDAYKDGADYYQGLGYGVAAGGVEAATEKLTSGIPVFGKGMVDDVGKAIVKESAEGAVKAGAKVGAQRVVKNMVDEAAEEAIAEIANPALKSIYKGKDAFNEYGESDYWAGVGESALVGGLTSAVYGGTLGKVKKLGGSSSIESDAREVVSDIEYQTERMRKLEENGNLTAEKETQIKKVIKADVELLSRQLQKTSADKRAAVLKDPTFSSLFAEDGTVKAEATQRMDNAIKAASDTSHGLDRRYYSESARGREQEIIDGLAAQGTKVVSGELTAEESKAYTAVRKAHNKLRSLGFVDTDLVLAESMPNDNAYLDGKTVVLGRDALTNGTYIKTLVHETTHFTEGTNEWLDVTSYVFGKDGSSVTSLIDRVKNSGYGVTQDDVNVVLSAVKEGKLSETEFTEKQRTLISEVVAMQMEETFADERSVEHLVNDNPSLAKRIWERIKALVESFGKSKEERQELQNLRKTEELFRKALQNAGVEYIEGEIKKSAEDQAEKWQNEIGNYTNQERESILRSPKNLIANSIEDIRDFVENTPKTSTFLFVGKLNTVALQKAKEITALSTDSLSLVLHSDEIRHLIKHHGNTQTEQLRGQIAIDRDNIDLVIETVMNPTTVEKSTDASGTVSLIFKKEINGKISAVTVLSQKKKALTLKSAWITKEKQHISPPSDVQAPNQTPNSELSMNAVSNNSIPQTEEKSTLSDKKSSSKIRESRKITAGMSDAERYDILKNRRLSLSAKVNYEKLNQVNSFDPKDFESSVLQKKKALLVVLGEQFSVFKDYQNTDIELDFGFSKSNLRHSAQLQKSNYYNLAKLLTCFDQVIENAIGIEIHNRNDEGYKFDAGLKNVYVLTSAFIDGTNIIPVKLEIKEFSDKKNTLYVAIALESIKTDGIVKQEDTTNGIAQQYSPPSDISIADFFKNINPSDQSFYKYIPKQFWSDRKIKHSLKAAASTDLFDGTAARKINTTPAQLIKMRANYTGEKVFNKKNIKSAIKKIQALAIFSAAERNGLVENLFSGFNLRVDSRGYEAFGELMYDKIHARVLQESEFELSEEQIRIMDEQILNALGDIVNSGQDIVKTKLEQSVSRDELKKQADYWHNEYQKATEQIKIRGRILSTAQKIKDLKTGAYVNASQYRPDIFKGTLEKLSRIQFRGNMSVSGTRGIFKDLGEWYNNSDNKLYSPAIADSGVAGRFDNEIKSMMSDIANGDGAFTTDELLKIEKVVSYFKGEIETYNTILRNGQRVEAQPIAESYIEKAKQAREIQLKCGVFRYITRNKYAVMVADPATLMRQADGYMNGFFTEMFEEMRQGEITSAVNEMELTREFQTFWKNNKSYRKRYNEVKIEINGKEVPLGYAISLYMTYQRKQAQAGLILSGFDILDGDKKVTVYRGTDEKLTQKQIEDLSKKRAAEIKAKLTEKDLELVAIMERAFEGCRKLKIDVDMALKHYTNVDKSGYYFPIRRSQIAQNVDMFSMFEGDRVSNLSMNKDTVKGAKNALLIEPAHLVFMRHVKATSLYSGLGIFTDNFNRLFNLNVNSNFNRPETIKSTLEADKFPKTMVNYFTEIKKDIEGISTKEQSTQFFNDAVRIIRSTYAKYQLGANPKVWTTQFSSLFASTNILDYSSLARGFAVKGKADEVDKYCKLAWLRNVDDMAVKAQAVTDKIGKLGDFLMTPIGWVDRGVVVHLFGACQVQVAKDSKLALGTEENKKAAGELLQKVILETQQNSLASERSAAMRTNNDLLKSFTMFSADAMKVFSRFVDAFGEREVLRSLIKNEKDPKVKAEYEARLKQINKQCTKSISALVATSFFTSLMALLFKLWYRKDDEEDFGTFCADMLGNMIGGLPIVRDVYSFFADGYEMENFMASTFNDVLSASLNSFTMLGDAASGKDVSEQDIAKSIKNLVFASGQLTGIPWRNAYNFVTGNINRFFPATGYKIDSLFYSKAYSSDLSKAIENEDEAMIATIAGLMLNENVGGIESEAARTELNRLVTEGFDVIPRGVGDTITYDGETYELTSREKKEFSKIYNIANESLTDMVKLARYKEATDEVKQKAIAFVYDVYYKLALQDFLGEDLETKTVLFAEAIDIEKLALIVATARSLTADTDKDGKTVNGSRKKKIQAYINSLHLKAAEKYMIMGYLGYSNINGEAQVKAHINKLNLTKQEKSKLLEYSGYAAS